MSLHNDRLRSSSSQPNTTSISSSQIHGPIHSEVHSYTHSYSYPPLNTPLLVVSPTSPVSTPSRLPVIVPRPCRKQPAPVIHCTSWLHPKEGKTTPAIQSISYTPLPPCRKSERTSLQFLSTSQQQGFRGSKIPIRSSRVTHQGLGVDQTSPRTSRSKSLTCLSTEDLLSASSDLRQLASQVSSPRLSLHRSQTPTFGSQRDLSNSNSLCSSLTQSGRTSPSRPVLRRLSSSNSYLSSNSLQSPPSPSATYRNSLRVVRRSCEDPLKVSSEPYETPHYFTFHLTLRSPAKCPSRQMSKANSRCGQTNSYGNRHTEASRAATRCVEDMILQTCAVPSPEMLQSVRLPHSIHMPQVPSCDISIDSGCKGEGVQDQETINNDRIQRKENEGEEEEGGDEVAKKEQDDEDDFKQRRMINKDSVNRSNTKYGSAKSFNNDSSQDTTVESSFELDSIGADIHCLSFGIVDCLNAVLKDSEHDEIESNCSECGSGLGISPPTRLFETDSTIEASAVSSDLPLKGLQIPRPSAFTRKKTDMRNLKWRSCQELLGKQTKRRLFHRQLSDVSLKAQIPEKTTTGTSVEVYDGNVGVSIVTLSRNNRNSAASSSPSSSVMKRSNRRCISAMEDHLLKKSSPLSSRVPSRMERQLVREESGESMDYGYHDSLAVEPSDTEYYEQMDMDDCNVPPLTSPTEQCNESPTFPSQQISYPNSKQLRPLDNDLGPKAQNYNGNNLTSNANKSSDAVRIPGTQRPLLVDTADVDHVLGILDDDGMGPGLSEDEMNSTDSPPTSKWMINCFHPSARGVGMISPHKILWYLQKESRRRSNEMSVRRVQPLLTDTGRSSITTPADRRVQYSGREGSLQYISVSDTSQPTSAMSHQVCLYSDASQGDSSAEESDNGAELSDLERCVLSLTHRRSQLRKQDTNAFLIAPPEYKIGDDVSTVPEDPHS